MARKSKPVSFISWNTEEFLIRKLDSLINNNTIVFYMTIKHFPEDDETKIHWHLFMIPNGTIDTDAVREVFTELDPEKPEKPIRLSPYRPSKFLDAYLYFLHDPDYLLSLGQSRKYTYSEEDLICSDKTYLHELLLTSDRSKLNGNKVGMLKKAVNAGVSFNDLLLSGVIPIQQINQYKTVYSMVQKITYRNGKKGHGDSLEENIKNIENLNNK